MSKNIVLCCDGTGNEVSAKEYSNVVKLYIQLAKDNPTQQITYYDPGLGTMGVPGFSTRTITSATRLMGLAFGYGLRTNLADAYRYLMQHYEEGDRVFLFGFSRGAYTVRALGGMLYRCGLLKPGNENLIPHVIKRYFHRKRGKPDWKGMARIRKHFSRPCGVHFVGVWDTVKSVGICRRSLILTDTANLKGVNHGRHAVSLNEKRSKYRPNLWNRPNDENYQQVWFAGVHSDIGGGYEECSLSDITLQWMIREAKPYGLDVDRLFDEPVEPDPPPKMHNPLWPFWWILGWKRRTVPVNKNQSAPWVHQTVKDRIEHDPQFAAECRCQLPENVTYVNTQHDE